SNFKADEQLKGKEEQDALEESKGGEAIEGGEKTPELEEQEGQKTLASINISREEIVNFVELKPAEAAQVVRALMTKET
ncbi:MAG TPA: hypothetical protein VJ941_09960, partial [Gracilimonas sp.]|nr:hypothetical protein [Gracilimonas sp.]HKK25942.1 hypothetical protein [Gracilimonas sp.]